MRKIIFGILCFAVLFTLLFQSVSAEEYSFRFESDDRDTANKAYSSYLESLPDDIKDKLSENIASYDTEYFALLIKNALKESVVPAIGILSTLIGIVILSSLFQMFSKTAESSMLSKTFTFTSTVCMALAVCEIQTSVFNTVKTLLGTVSKTVSVITPAMETVNVVSGNITSATVNSTGISLMITFAEGIFDKVLYPAVVACFVIAVISALTENGGIAYMSKLIKGLVTGALIFIMTLMTFVLSVQNSAATATDTLASKTLKFAVGSYIPVVGGSVSESLSVLGAGVGVIKQTLGITGIVTIIIAVSLPLFNLILDRIAVGLSSAIAGAIGCEREKNILSEAGGVITMMIAISLSCAVMFIIALGIFCKTPVSLSQ